MLKEHDPLCPVAVLPPLQKCLCALIERVEYRTRGEWFSAAVNQMEHDSRCIADGHRGNGTACDDFCCQVCQEIECDDDCPVNVAKLREQAARAEALRDAAAAIDKLVKDMANWSSDETRAAVDAFDDITYDEWTWAQRGVLRAAQVVSELV